MEFAIPDADFGFGDLDMAPSPRATVLPPPHNMPAYNDGSCVVLQRLQCPLLGDRRPIMPKESGWLDQVGMGFLASLFDTTSEDNVTSTIIY